jgi:hypothetical protein
VAGALTSLKEAAAQPAAVAPDPRASSSDDGAVFESMAVRVAGAIFGAMLLGIAAWFLLQSQREAG